jgi:hypothetical protein
MTLYFPIVLYFDVASMLEFQFQGSGFNAMANDSFKVPSMYLRFNLSLEIDSGVQCGVGLKSEVILCTNSPPSLLSLTWLGDANIRGTRAMGDLSFYLDPNERNHP